MLHEIEKYMVGLDKVLVSENKSWSWASVKGGSADVATGKRRTWMRRTSAFYQSYTATTIA